MYDIYDVIVLFIFILLVMYWWRISEQKTFAIRNAREYCKGRNVQLLDQTLVFQGLRLEKCTINAASFSVGYMNSNFHLMVKIVIKVKSYLVALIFYGLFLRWMSWK